MAQISNPMSIAQQGTYTQTYSESTRTQAASALSTTVSIALITEVAAQVNATNTAVNELKKLTNGLIDDMQAAGIVG